jgi:hypothetical protein
MEFIDRRLRTLSALLHLQGDLDSCAELINRSAAVSAHDAGRDRGGTFWIGASFAKGGKSALKIYINGKSGTENEQWARLGEFAAHFGASEKQQELRRLLNGKMAPLGMAISLTQDQSPTGRIYLSGYGHGVPHYEDLLRHCTGMQYVNLFREYSEGTLEDDRDYPAQSAVFSVELGPNESAGADAKIEFCGHCLFRSDQQARERCLRWLALQKIEASAYVELLEVIAGQMSPPELSKHIYSGLGWKQQQEYSTIYMKPHSACKAQSPEL